LRLRAVVVAASAFAPARIVLSSDRGGVAMRIDLLAAAAALAWAAPGDAQAADPPSAADVLRGHWTGLIEEPDSPIPHYTLSVHLDTDAIGRPLGTVRYDAFPCAGVWSDVSRDGAVWRFEETITEGGANCARHVRIELVPHEETIEVRLRAQDYDGAWSRGTLSRRPATDPQNPAPH
jgi:hypothetical protein